MKELNGQSVKKVVDSYNTDASFMGVALTKSDDDETTFNILRKRFFQTLHDNIVQRFPHTSLLQAASALDQSSWPVDHLERALFGDDKIAFLCKEFNIPSKEAADIVMEYCMYKKRQAIGPKLATFVLLLQVLPISSADCERGFSQMNLHHTDLRNSLAVKTVSDLLMVSNNGPPLRDFNVRKHVLSWLKSGRHGALDKATGIPAKVQHSSKSAKLFSNDSSAQS